MSIRTTFDSFALEISGEAINPQIVTLEDGKVIVAYAKASPAFGFDFFVQRIEIDGSGVVMRVEEETVVRKSDLTDKSDFDIDAQPGGGFVLSYRNVESADLPKIVTNSFDFNGQGQVIRQDDQDFSTADPNGNSTLFSPSVVSRGEGDFTHFFIDRAGKKEMLLSDGPNQERKVHGEFNGGPNTELAVDLLTNGNSVVVIDPVGDHGARSDLLVRIIDSEGKVVRNLSSGNGPADKSNDPEVTALADGGFVVAWTGVDRGVSTAEFQVFNANGDARTGIVEVAKGSGPDVVALEDGGFVVLANSGFADVVGAILFDDQGQQFGPAFSIEDVKADDNIEATLLPDGQIALTYTLASTGQVGMEIIEPQPGEIINGDGGNNTLRGSNFADEIRGFDGNDLLFGQDGDDFIDGGQGSDNLSGDAGNDKILGGQGNDFINGGDGDDKLIGGDGEDSLNGGAGNDVLNGGDTLDFLTGGDGDDILNGDGGNDNLFGGRGDDIINGGDGDDTINLLGADGTDFGRDTVDGGAGFDTLFIETAFVDNPTDIIDLTGLSFSNIEEIEALNGFSDSGNTTTVLLSADQANNHLGSNLQIRGDFSDGDNTVVRIDMGAETALDVSQWTFESFDSPNSFLDIRGNENDETITGSVVRDVIQGGQGNDTLNGFDGNDRLVGGKGDDVLIGGTGDDRIEGGSGDDIAVFSGARSAYTATLNSNNVLTVTGQDGRDKLSGVETLRFDDGDVGIRDFLDGIGVVTRLQAEDATLSGGYTVESSGLADGGQLIRISSGDGATGSAEFDLAGEGIEAGIYNISLRYIDENDGESTLTVSAGDFSDTIVFNDDANSGNSIQAQNFRTEVIKGVEIGEDGKLQLDGLQDGNEFVRVDFVELEKVAKAPVRIQAEDGDLSGTYAVERNGNADGGELIRVNGGDNKQGRARFELEEFGVSEGTYDLVIHYVDESDGNSKLIIDVGDLNTSFRLDDDDNSGKGIEARNFRTKTFEDVEIGRNELLDIVGDRDKGEFVRIDYIEFVDTRGQEDETVVTSFDPETDVTPLGTTTFGFNDFFFG